LRELAGLLEEKMAIYILLLLFAWIGTIKEASCKNIHNSTNEIYQNCDFYTYKDQISTK
jgi:hypothetical protein